ncbi:MAG TPA: sigma 54-interacting transcriptional regulator [Polyangiaceae bacterium]|nr:sigma 54-interacting transcriptional regulator [Polyangiaceae bacterium]
MSLAVTQTTTSDGLDGLLASELVPVIRWVFPLPPLSPLWPTRSRVTLGRDPDVDAVLPSNRVSRRHAELSRSGALWLLNDLDSKNGVFVNGKRCSSAALSPGDVIRIGDYVGIYLSVPPNADLSFAQVGPQIFGGFAHRAAVKRLAQLASSDLPVVLEGATGTGKERFARAAHQLSQRQGPLLAVNCATYSKAVAAAELFGYRKGAFTGADQASPGHIRAAQGGTLFLDELVELPFEVQAMLLRAIENREILSLGETRPTIVDVKFVAASQIPLADAVEQGRFRADLRARLEGTVIGLPLLGHCRDIVPELFAELFKQHRGKQPLLSAAFAERLCLHEWPLNVRELDTHARRLALVTADGERLEPGALEGLAAPLKAVEPRAEAGRRRVTAPGRSRAEHPYEQREMEGLVAALKACGGNITKAAASLGLSRPKAYRMLEAATQAGLVD